MRDAGRFDHSDLWVGAPPGASILAENIGVSPYMSEIHDPIHVGMHNAHMKSTAHRANIRDCCTVAQSRSHIGRDRQTT